MRLFPHAQNIPGERKWNCDDCGTIFSREDGFISAGFGLCNSCAGSDWRKSMNIPAEDELIVIKRREEFSELEYKKILSSIRVDELIDCKMKYDKAFIKYWSARGRGNSKFQPISLEEFKERLRNKDFFEKYGKLKSR